MKKFFTKFTKQTDLTTQILIVAGIIIVLNVLSTQIFTRIDLTEGKIYSISDTTKNTLRQLDDLVNITVYFSEILPPQLERVRQDVKDVLSEYSNYANGNINVKFVDPKDDEELQRRLQILGIPRLQFNILSNDKYEVINGYIGLTIGFGDNEGAIPVVNDTSNLEYQLTSGIKKIMADKEPVIAIASGHGEPERESLSQLEQSLKDIYQVQTVDLSTGDAIADNIDTLLVIGSTEEFTEREQYVIDQFLMEGKSALFLIDGVNTDDNLVATKNTTNINNLLNKYGFVVGDLFVLDKNNESASFSQGFISFTAPYPLFVKVAPSGFDSENVIVAKLQELILPWSSPIDVNPDEDISVLARTTTDSWVMSEPFDLNPQGNFGFNNDTQIHNLAASRFGELQSAFDDYVAKDGEDGEHIASADNARVLVVGSSLFVTDRFMQRYPDNMIFIQNAIDATSLDEDLIAIRTKEVSTRPLDELEDSTKKSLRYLNVFGVTALVLGFGLMRYMLRKKNRFADDL